MPGWVNAPRSLRGDLRNACQALEWEAPGPPARVVPGGHHSKQPRDALDRFLRDCRDAVFQRRSNHLEVRACVTRRVSPWHPPAGQRLARPVSHELLRARALARRELLANDSPLVEWNDVRSALHKNVAARQGSPEVRLPP